MPEMTNWAEALAEEQEKEKEQEQDEPKPASVSDDPEIQAALNAVDAVLKSHGAEPGHEAAAQPAPQAVAVAEPPEESIEVPLLGPGIVSPVDAIEALRRRPRSITSVQREGRPWDTTMDGYWTGGVLRSYMAHLVKRYREYQASIRRTLEVFQDQETEA